MHPKLKAKQKQASQKNNINAHLPDISEEKLEFLKFLADLLSDEIIRQAELENTSKDLKNELEKDTLHVTNNS